MRVSTRYQYSLAKELSSRLPEDFSSRVLIGAILFFGTAVMVGSLIAPLLFPDQFSSSGRDVSDLVAFLTAW